MRWKADCGHWMVVYSLEPTPDRCPDCADKDRDALSDALQRWSRDLSSAIGAAEECAVGDAVEWVRENALGVSDEAVAALQHIGDRASEAAADLELAHGDMQRLIAAIPPKSERLTMPEAS
ncbi:hypothetical protein [Mycolicibacterium vaccae]|uniref:hypothetical protein n=1 Tax=Mycolicibacterium vaccae TaxID=1810 RepID=UPI003D0883C8